MTSGLTELTSYEREQLIISEETIANPHLAQSLHPVFIRLPFVIQHIHIPDIIAGNFQTRPVRAQVGRQNRSGNQCIQGTVVSLHAGEGYISLLGCLSEHMVILIPVSSHHKAVFPFTLFPTRAAMDQEGIKETKYRLCLLNGWLTTTSNMSTMNCSLQEWRVIVLAVEQPLK